MRHLMPLRYVDAVARAGSIRKAAEHLAITSTALNRRMLAMEEELGVPLFERLPGGVRLSTAGELFVLYARGQIADMERLRSRIADLSGERRGHVSIVAGHACLEHFLPQCIEAYRREHPAVTFAVKLCNRHEAETRLANYEADMAMVFEGEWGPVLQIMGEYEQAVHLLCHPEHPLARSGIVRLRDCLNYPMALHTRANGVRALLERAAARQERALPVVIESDSFGFLKRCLEDEQLISFQIPIALSVVSDGTGFCRRKVDSRDLPSGKLLLGKLRGRNLPVAASRFAERLRGALDESGEGVSSEERAEVQSDGNRA